MIDLTRARATAAATMTDRATIKRASTDAPTYDAAALTNTPAAPTTVHADLACTVKFQGESLSTRDGDDRALSDYEVLIPPSATGINVGDVLTVTAVGLNGDVELIGVPLTIGKVDHGTRQVIRRLRATGVVHNAQAVVR